MVIGHQYDDTVMSLFSEVFCAMPLCALINRKVFIVHGGLTAEDGVKLEDIDRVDRFREPPEGGLMSDLLWADPQPMPGVSSRPTTTTIAPMGSQCHWGEKAEPVSSSCLC